MESEQYIERVILPNNQTGEMKITRIPCVRSNQIKRKKIVNIIFCLPGNTFSEKFTQSWSRLLIYCINNGINSEILQMYSSNIYHVREAFLSTMVMGDTPNIRPFGGKKYDYCLWIDSDQTFTPNDLEILISDDKDIVSGAIKAGKGDHFAFGWYDEKVLKETGELLRMAAEDIEGRKELIEVDFCGFAFTLVKYGVFESLRFPYFDSLPFSAIKGFEDKLGMMGEDLSTLFRLKQKGYKIYIDPRVRIGHEKRKVMR